ncbi:MAG: DNA-binding protein [Oscillospiraceae bacterium]|nr:DNA-binding protein [Oscillospiraceae bacterium]
METTELILLYDYYGSLLTERQRECFELRYNQDLSLGEIGQELGISRQGVYENLSRAEGLLMNMEEKTGCVRRDRACRKAIHEILELSHELRSVDDPRIKELAEKIEIVAGAVEE